MSSSRPPQDPTTDESPSAPVSGSTVRHRTERDAAGRVWRFVYDPAAQAPMTQDGLLRVRCTTGNARATIVVRDDWLTWPRQQLLDELAAALHLQRGGTAGTAVAPGAPAAGGDRRVARRRLVRDARGVSWNCVYDPSAPGQAEDGDRVRVRCTAGRDRIDLELDASWHRLGDRQLAELIERTIDARRR